VVGLSAALIAFADFIYATPDTFLLTPFTTIGLVSEGGASYTFPRRMGYARANEALLLGKRHSSSDLVSCGFINQLFPKENFLEHIRNHVSDKFGDHLNHDSMLRIKKQICLADEHIFEAVNIREAVEGVQRFAEGIPQKAFAEIASGARKHKL
jgi:peroxisomal 3,2-trans-enoyl-CoA isomerase